MVDGQTVQWLLAAIRLAGGVPQHLAPRLGARGLRLLGLAPTGGGQHDAAARGPVRLHFGRGHHLDRVPAPLGGVPGLRVVQAWQEPGVWAWAGMSWSMGRGPTTSKHGPPQPNRACTTPIHTELSTRRWSSGAYRVLLSSFHAWAGRTWSQPYQHGFPRQEQPGRRRPWAFTRNSAPGISCMPSKSYEGCGKPNPQAATANERRSQVDGEVRLVQKCPSEHDLARPLKTCTPDKSRQGVSACTLMPCIHNKSSSALPAVLRGANQHLMSYEVGPRKTPPGGRKARHQRAPITLKLSSGTPRPTPLP